MSNDARLPFALTMAVRDACLCLHVQRAARALARRFDEELRPVGLTHGQFSLLMALNRPTPATMGEVTRVLAMDRTTLTANLKPLERRGLVTVRGRPGRPARPPAGADPRGPGYAGRRRADLAPRPRRDRAGPGRPRHAARRPGRDRLAAYGRGMNSWSSASGSFMRPARQSAFACSIRALEEETKFHSMKRSPTGSPPIASRMTMGSVATQR
jgi:DNA-binding transcriptional ArsR family regulator